MPAEERLAALEARIDRLEGYLAADPDARTRFLLAHVAEDLHAAVERAAENVKHAEALALSRSARAQADGERASRQKLALGQVYQAPYTGYVALFFTGGVTDKVELLVGWSSPPTAVVCSLNSQNDFSGYAGCVIRRGEFWLARSSVGHASGVECVFTPFL
jgi:hypothetical protein